MRQDHYVQAAAAVGRAYLRTDIPGRQRHSDIQTFSGQEMEEHRSKVQAVFQGPWSSLSPSMKVKDIVSEAMIVNRM